MREDTAQLLFLGHRTLTIGFLKPHRGKRILREPFLLRVIALVWIPRRSEEGLCPDSILFLDMEPDSPMPEQNAALGGKGKPVTNSAVKSRKAEGAARLVLPSGLGACGQGVQTALVNSGGQTISALSRHWLRWSIYTDFAQQFTH